ncbi:hypothetical protein [Cryobacterium sp. TMT1-66-1]|uniref:hypothetical protein n=1 Tax=Cryobacterium sp. TMT1-66-1 TaxID=1259242 RepID=UPI00351A9C2D
MTDVRHAARNGDVSFWWNQLGRPVPRAPLAGSTRAGGYVGTGVATTNVAGRTLNDLILGRDSNLVHLPWVNHRVRAWEPEPLRWLAVTALYRAYSLADRAELAGRRTTSPLARVADVVSGRGH